MICGENEFRVFRKDGSYVKETRRFFFRPSHHSRHLDDIGPLVAGLCDTFQLAVVCFPQRVAESAEAFYANVSDNGHLLYELCLDRAL